MSVILLSDAIRLGAMLGPQLKNQLVDGTGASCALGSACLAMGMKTAGEMMDGFGLHFPEVAKNIGLGIEIVSRNNSFGQTREQIADWLVKSGNDCESITVAPAQEIATALVSAHMVAK